ncbi:hypothetical protein LDENG_00220660 [Lucifuga dentata]|nr:hypothetical protein LDENG_00220660 [Lucifuga dentata]
MSVCRSSSMKLAGFSCFSCIFSFLAAGKPVQIGSPEQVPAVSGDDVILPCTLNASIKPSGVLVEWSRVDRSPPVTVHVSRNGKELVKEKAKAYLGRTAMMEDSSSLKLYGVRHHDNGTYRCHVRQPEMEKEVFVSLIVAEVGDVWMVIHRTSAGRLLLSCESSGWNPPPVLTLLDAQRNVLAKMESASIGPDSLYGVRSGMDEALANGNGTLICRVEIPELELAKESRMILSGKNN